MNRLPILLVLALLICPLRVLCNDFKVPLRVSNGLGEFDTLWFGVNAHATYCIDESLGESSIYPQPPIGLYVKFIDTRLGSNACLYDGTKIDLRPYISPTQVDSYLVSFHAQFDYPYTFTWPDLNAYYTNPVWLRNDYAGSKVNINMKNQTSFAVEDTLHIEKLYIITGDPVAGGPTAPSNLSAEVLDVGQVTLSLLGSANPNGSETIVWFEWGTTTSYGNTTASQSIGSGTSGVSVFQDLNGLTAQTKYHFRLVAQNVAGTVNGPDRYVTTIASGTIGTTILPIEIADDGGNHVTRWIGVHPDATLCIDELMGESPLYPIPPSGFDARLIVSCAYDGLNADVRDSVGSSQSDLYRLQFQPGEGVGDHPLFPMTLSWPGASSWFNGAMRLADPYGGLGVNVDMTSQTSCSLPESLGIHILLIRTGTDTPPPPRPAVLTHEASRITDNGADLRGVVNPNGYATNEWFEWGTTTAYGQSTSSTPAGSGTSTVDIAERINGLASATSYHYRIVAANANGTMYGPDQAIHTSNVTGFGPTNGTSVSAFRLFQNYPNPFNPTTTITFAIAQRELVTLKVFDLLGREIATLVERHLDRGSYSIPWSAETRPSGIYICRLTAGAYTEVKKLVVTK